MSDPTDSIPRQEVAELLAAIVEALHVPIADRWEDRGEADRLRGARMAYVRGVLRSAAGGITSPSAVESAATALRVHLPKHCPVTYTPYVPDPTPGALLEQKHQAEDPAVPPLTAAEPSPDPDYLASVAAGYVDLPDWDAPASASAVPVGMGQATADAWNAAHPVGTPVTAYPDGRDDEPLRTTTRTPAWVLGHGEPVVSVHGYAGGIALSHVFVEPPVPAREVATVPVAGEVL